MMMNTTLNQLRTLKLDGLAGALEEQADRLRESISTFRVSTQAEVRPARPRQVEQMAEAAG